MIVVVGGIKGGSGKTTIATNLTVTRSYFYKTLLVDADEQKSATDWVEQRSQLDIPIRWTTIQLAGKHIYHEISKMKEDYQDIIIDVGGRDTTSQRAALTVADVFLIPFKPRSLDIWTLGLVKTLVNEISMVNPKLKAFALINMADPRGSDNIDAKEVISEIQEIQCLKTTIGNRKSFANAASEGLGVSEMEDIDVKAYREIKDLHDEIYGNNTKST